MLPVDEARAQSVVLAATDGCTSNCTIVENGGTATFTLTYAGLSDVASTVLNVPPETAVADGVGVKYVVSASSGPALTFATLGENYVMLASVTTGELGGSGNAIITYTVRTTSRADLGESFVVSINSVGYTDAGLGSVTPSGRPLMFTVTTAADLVPTFSTTVTDQTWTAGTGIGTITLPTATGGDGNLTYSLTPDLPAGISFNATTRKLAGTPTTGLDAREFTYTATDNDDSNPDSAILRFSIAVDASMPNFGNKTIAAQRYILNEDIVTLTLPTATGGTGTVTYALTPALPAGLSFAAGSREISGTVSNTATIGTTQYTLTATDSAPTTRASATLTFTITISEFAVEMEEVKAEVETVATLVGAVQTGLTAGLVRSRFSVQPSSGVAGRDTPYADGATGGATTSLTLPDNPRDLADILGGLALEHTADADSGGQYAVWLRGQYTSMDGDPTLNGITVNYDGNSSGLGVGAEKSTGRYVAGVAVNWLATDLDISSSSDDTTLSKYEESLVMVAPYVSLRRGARTFWFSGGYGIGDADATLEEGEGKASADVQVTFANAGADFVLSERGKNRIIGGLSVLGTRKVVDPLNFAAADVVIPKITLNTFRAQGEITYSRTIEAGAGRVVRPYIGVATLHDAGDRVNDDSHAMDLRGGVDFDGARFDVSLEASTELLREDHESWSVSGSARYQFEPGGRGASLALDGIGGEASDIGLEGGYGMMMRQVHRDALLTPFAGIRHGSESGEFSSGMRLAVGGDMDADLRAARAFRNDEDTLKLNFRQTF